LKSKEAIDVPRRWSCASVSQLPELQTTAASTRAQRWLFAACHATEIVGAARLKFLCADPRFVGARMLRPKNRHLRLIIVRRTSNERIAKLACETSRIRF
jgi:hypothetical protein